MQTAAITTMNQKIDLCDMLVDYFGGHSTIARIPLEQLGTLLVCFTTYLHPRLSERAPPMAGPMHGASFKATSKHVVHFSFGGGGGSVVETDHWTKIKHAKITPSFLPCRDVTDDSGAYLLISNDCR